MTNNSKEEMKKRAIESEEVEQTGTSKVVEPDTEAIEAEIIPEPEEPDESVEDLASELTSDLQKLQAEFSNYRRRTEAARAEWTHSAKESVIKEVLPLLDNIGRALAAMPEELADNAWTKGVQQVAKQSDETLAKLGVERIPALGQPFDPHLHEAISFEDGDGDQEIVVEELQAGYKSGDKVLRPAMVKVGKRATP